MEWHYGLYQDQDLSPNGYGNFTFLASTQVEVDPKYNLPTQPSFSSPQPLQPLVTLPQWPSKITGQ